MHVKGSIFIFSYSFVHFLICCMLDISTLAFRSFTALVEISSEAHQGIDSRSTSR